MSRFFKADTNTLNAIREAVMNTDPKQPNGRAGEPWPIDGDFSADGEGYLALEDHHTTGDYAPLVEQFITTPGVEEIDEAAYRSAMPQPDI